MELEEESERFANDVNRLEHETLVSFYSPGHGWIRFLVVGVYQLKQNGPFTILSF